MTDSIIFSGYHHYRNLSLISVNTLTLNWMGLNFFLILWQTALLGTIAANLAFTAALKNQLLLFFNTCHQSSMLIGQVYGIPIVD